jgi:hypothetical protein
VSVTLQTTRSKCDDDDGTLEQAAIKRQLIVLLVFRFLFLAFASVWGNSGAEDTNSVGSLETTNLFCCFQAVHDGHLDIHKHQMEAASSPFVDSDLTVQSSAPSDLQTLHEGLQKSQVDYIVLYNQHIDRRNCTVEQGWRKCCFRASVGRLDGRCTIGGSELSLAARASRLQRALAL